METLTLKVGETAAGAVVNVFVKPHSVYAEANEVRLMRGHTLVVDVAYVHQDAAGGVVEALSKLASTWCVAEPTTVVE